MKNIPNILSTIRILLVPVFVLVFFSGTENAHAAAALVFLAASVTDFLDGYIARRFNFITNLGKILDPAGDKLMTLAMVICLAIEGTIPGWIPCFFGSKEVLMAAGGIFIHGRITREMPSSNFLGKTATFVLFCVGVVLMLFDVPPAFALGMIIVTVLLAAAAFISYIVMFAEIWKKHRSKKEN